MKNILLIDDDPLVLESISIMLVENGYNVETATNGELGLRKAAEPGFDLIITDILMPEKDGLETLTELKNAKNPAKVIAISGGGRGSSITYLKVAEVLGADCSLAKPFSSSQLITAVKHLIN
ncbi:response regulator transcription factor [Kordiimonas aquimaris]|uniref:response regulator transcription factor n=1 Tax=Kordiimonas aquimaris TaxID=707591 RepID=UPI0021D3A9DA|nr:response regulator [Kordiimonas aquimaris]